MLLTLCVLCPTHLLLAGGLEQRKREAAAKARQAMEKQEAEKKAHEEEEKQRKLVGLSGGRTASVGVRSIGGAAGLLMLVQAGGGGSGGSWCTCSTQFTRSRSAGHALQLGAEPCPCLTPAWQAEREQEQLRKEAEARERALQELLAGGRPL